MIATLLALLLIIQIKKQLTLQKQSEVIIVCFLYCPAEIWDLAHYHSTFFDQ